MLLIRRFEERAGQLYGMGLIGGFCHLYIGQEAVVVGMQANVRSRRPADHRLSRSWPYAGRGHGSQGRDGRADRPLHRLFARQGRLDAHVLSQEKKFYGGHGIVGAQVPLGTGLAFANKYRGNNGVCLTYFGDGAANQGQVYESFNMAELWKLPVVYVIENNQYAMGTSVARSSALTDFSKRGVSFNIPGVQVDGMDVEAVQAAGAEAMAHCRAGKGPIILEMKTYRYRGHSMSDPAKYRTREEVTEVREKRDPIEHFGQKLIAARRRHRRRSQDDRQGGQGDRRRRGGIRHRKPGTGSRRTLHGYARLMSTADPDARAVAHHGRGQACPLAGEGRRHRQVRRHPGRNRNRQGHDGIRSGR